MLPTAISRRPFHHGLQLESSETKWVETWLQILLRQDGSATRLCEIVANGPVALEILHQSTTAEVPEEVRVYLPGEEFIERQVCMSAHGEVMMDNLSFVSLRGLDPDLRGFLEAGTSPIGHILDRMWTRKIPVPPPPSVQARLWDRCGVPDPSAVRSYILATPSGSCMHITETFRHGMRIGL